MRDHKEERFIRRLQKNNDKQAAEMLCRKYYPEIYAYLYCQFPDKETVMDITQEVFVSMLQTIWSYDRTKTKFRTWLYQVATYKLIDYYRSKAYHQAQQEYPLDQLEIAQEDQLEDTVVQRILTADIMEFLSGEKYDLEEIFRLHFFAGYTFEEIAGVMDLSVSTVKSRYYAGLKKLRKKYGN